MGINTPKELAENIAKFVNVIGDTEKNREFVRAMANEHRTLQQAFTRLAIQWIEHMASLPDGGVDARNAASRKIARKMLRGDEILADYGGEPSKYLPCV